MPNSYAGGSSVVTSLPSANPSPLRSQIDPNVCRTTQPSQAVSQLPMITPVTSPGPRSPLTKSPQNTTRPARRLSITIPQRLDRSEWVNLEGLVSCALSALGKDECTAINELGRGSHNSLYELRFSDGTNCAASISNSPPKFFSAEAKRSEIATMQYLHSSPLYNIPIPRIYAWDLTFDNPVGAPYVLRECVRGKNMSECGRFYKLNGQQKLQVIKELADVQAELSKPSEFKQLGCIYQKEDGKGEFYIGKMATMPSGNEEEDRRREPFLGPYSSLDELWQARIERETVTAAGQWSWLPSDSSLPSDVGSPKGNPIEFGELMQLLSGMTRLFNPPDELSTLCIQHSDLAIRNVLFDEKTLKITGVIDWEFAAVLPLAVTARFPNDLGWEGNEFARSMGKLGNISDGEVWNHHYYDWTSLQGVKPPPAPLDMPSPPRSPTESNDSEGEDYLTTANASVNARIHEHREHEFWCDDGSLPSPPSPPLPPPPTSEDSQQDLNTRAAHLIELFYFRKYYAARVAYHDFELTRLFIDSVAYIKFNEVVMGGAGKWFATSRWIKKVYHCLREGCRRNRNLKNDIRAGRIIVRIPETFDYTRDEDQDLGGIRFDTS